MLTTATALLMPLQAFAQTAGQTPPPQPPSQPEERTTGLPPHVEWKFNFDAGWGTFGFANSYYNNPKGTEQEDLSDQWFEGYAKPSLSATYKLASSSELYGKVSVVGERTYGSVPAAFGTDVSSFAPEDLSFGWRSGQSIASLGEKPFSALKQVEKWLALAKPQAMAISVMVRVEWRSNSPAVSSLMLR